jgi:hypothetical protein
VSVVVGSSSHERASRVPQFSPGVVLFCFVCGCSCVVHLCAVRAFGASLALPFFFFRSFIGWLWFSLVCCLVATTAVRGEKTRACMCAGSLALAR